MYDFLRKKRGYIWKKSTGHEDCGELVLDNTNLNLHLFIIQNNLLSLALSQAVQDVGE